MAPGPSGGHSIQGEAKEHSERTRSRVGTMSTDPRTERDSGRRRSDRSAERCRAPVRPELGERDHRVAGAPAGADLAGRRLTTTLDAIHAAGDAADGPAIETPGPAPCPPSRGRGFWSTAFRPGR